MSVFAQLCLVLLLATFLMMGASLTGIGMGGGVVLSIIAALAVLVIFRRGSRG